MPTETQAFENAPGQGCHNGATPSGNELLLGLKRLDRLLERAIASAEAAYGPDAAKDAYRGLHLSRLDVESLLSLEPGAPLLWSEGETGDDPKGPEESASLLSWLGEAFGLSAFEMDVIVIAMAPELDLRYEKLYAYLQDHVAKKRPTVDLALNLLCPTADAKHDHRRYFLPDAPLIRNQLLHLISDSNPVETPLLAHSLKLDTQILDLLLGQQGLDQRLASFCELQAPDIDLDSIVLADALKQGLRSLVVKAREMGDPLRLHFHGLTGVGKRRCAEALAGELGLSLLTCDLARIPDAVPNWEQLSTLLFRAAWFQDAILYMDNTDGLPGDNNSAQYQILLDALDQDWGITILAGSRAWQPPVRSSAHLISLSFPIPDYAERRRLWDENLSLEGITLNEDALADLADRFRLTSRQIGQAVVTAKDYSRWRAVTLSSPIAASVESEDPNEDNRPPPKNATQLSSPSIVNDLFRAARAQSGQDLETLTRKIEPNYSWSDIVLPEDSQAQLQEICQRVSHRHRVLNDWGFDRKLSLGKGINALFAGPSGTGKTMAAEIIANALQLDLYRIDLSGVVSKYIGETEKNLDRIFRAAEDANAILLFDEADALFGKRSEVRDSHDRYANIEISYLLQKMEAYDGIAILATNLKGHLDEAFTRRLAFTVHFPFPDETSRRQIWSGIWPAETPLAEDVDRDSLAQRFKLSGGNIKNIALAAAFLAIEDGTDVSMAQVLHAVRREYQKMGKALSQEELHGTGEARPKVTRIAG